jgi:hypothetical protein
MANSRYFLCLMPSGVLGALGEREGASSTATDSLIKDTIPAPHCIGTLACCHSKPRFDPNLIHDCVFGDFRVEGIKTRHVERIRLCRQFHSPPVRRAHPMQHQQPGSLAMQIALTKILMLFALPILAYQERRKLLALAVPPGEPSRSRFGPGALGDTSLEAVVHGPIRSAAFRLAHFDRHHSGGEGSPVGESRKRRHLRRVDARENQGERRTVCRVQKPVFITIGGFERQSGLQQKRRQVEDARSTSPSFVEGSSIILARSQCRMCAALMKRPRCGPLLSLPRALA